MFCQRQSNHMINRIHERALRIAYNNYTASFDDLLIKDHSITIHESNIQALAVEIYKTQNGLNPIFMKDIFCSPQHGYNTRKKIFSYPNPKTVSYGTQSFGYVATKVWNSIPNEIRSCSDLISFKKRLSNERAYACSCNICKNYVQNLGYVTTT